VSSLRLIAFMGLCAGNVSAAEHDWPAPPRAGEREERVFLSLSQRAGLAEAPFVSTAFPEVSGFAMVLTGAAGVRISPVGWVRLRLPISFARLDFPAGAQVPETALGNLELALEHGGALGPLDPMGTPGGARRAHRGARAGGGAAR
jgi:hypothetical protein